MTDWKFLNKEVKFNEEYLKGAEVHKKVRKDLNELLLTKKILDMKYYDIAEIIEDLILKYTKENNLEKGIAFPIGLSVNECAAHWTPNYGEQKKWKYNDLVKIDFGVHYNGCIIDSAFSTSFNRKYDELISIGKEATNIGIKNSGIDCILGEIGKEVQEFIESKEITIDNKIYPLKSIKDLTGHLIEPYIIHGNKCIPNFNINYPIRMKENEIYALETFPTTGNGRTCLDLDCSHYMLNSEKILKNPNLNDDLFGKEKKLFNKVIEMRQTLPFCKKWLKKENIKGYQIPLNSLVNKGLVKSYPPIISQKNTLVIQFEHTIHIKESGVNVLTRGDDY
tara:strand:+ start:583 stop:1590 length:1008 start_codon:yes stop_codon:yes gene_type:complete